MPDCQQISLHNTTQQTMKTKMRTIDKAIIDQIRGTETRHTIRLTNCLDGYETCILLDQECGDMCIIQSYDNKITTTHIDENELIALKAVLL
jgi:hypothetical protein